MTIAGGLAGEARVLEDQARGVTDRLQLDRDDGFSPVGTARSRNPREFDQLIGDQTKKAAVVWVTLHRRLAFRLEFGLKKEHGVDLGQHQHRAGGGEPPIEARRPGLIKGRRRGRKVPLDTELVRPRRDVRHSDGANFFRHG
jgi:hypothetical protein